MPPSPRYTGRMWILDRDEPVPAVTAAVPVRFARFGPDALGELDRVLEPPGEAARRLAAGRRAYGGWVNGELAVYGWVSFNKERIGEQGLHIRLRPGEAYIWNCVTLPNYRRKGLYTAILSHMVHDLRAEGVRRIWIGADLDNAPSVRGIDRAGFRAVADMAVRTGPAGEMIRLEGLPGVPEELVGDAREALYGRRDAGWLPAP